MTSHIFQALKLQISSSYKFYLIYYLVNIALCLLIYFLKNIIELYSVLFIISFAYTFLMGVLNYSVSGMAYYSLKHDKRPFIISSLIINAINSLILSGIFLMSQILFTGNILIVSIVVYFLLMGLSYTFGSSVSIFLQNKKVINIILVTILLVLTLVLSSILKDGFINIFSSMYLIDGENFQLYRLIILGGSAILFVILTIINAFAYKKNINR